MELMGKRFCMVSDKEQLLQTLHLNNVPSVELVDPGVCVYPIIGRSFGHHQGKDMVIIHTKEQAMDAGYDYFTKLYVFENEYCLEIQGLTVQSVKIAVSKQMVFNEVPIRTPSFGWVWVESDITSLQEEWLMTAIRALYVTGLSSGYVKIGVSVNESISVIDINPSKTTYSENKNPSKLPFTIGADIEFMLCCDDELLPASTFFPIEGPIGCDERQIEQDSGEFALAEIRPDKSESPQELFNNINRLIVDATEMVPFKNVEFRSGSMPFFGYQCGGHIHFGVPLTLSLLRALDHYLAIPVAMVENSKTAKRRRKTKHGGIGRYRIKPYGFEYLSLSSWIIEPKITLSILSLAQLVVAHHHELEGDFLFYPFVQKAYYQSNQIVLKQLWTEIKSSLIKTSSYLQNKSEIDYLFEAIEKDEPINEYTDIRCNWGIIIGDQTYERGLTIQIPKKMRLKHHLIEGETTYISAGKRFSSATIQAYPFSFRHPNTVQLSKSLREKLFLPPDWNPKLSSANGHLTLGPIVGILATRPFDRQTTYFQHLCRLAHEKQMLVYIFEAHDIDWDQQLIKGTTMNGDGLFPFPAVIYDRSFSSGENKMNIDVVRFQLESVNKIPFVNPLSLFHLTGDKWKTHQLLEKGMEDFLPETRPLDNPTDITEMLDRLGEVYLKPLGGALSQGVIRVIRRPTGIFWMNIKEKEYHQLKNMDELFSLISPLVKNTPYLVQEGIRRMQFKGKNLEIRVYMQKNGQQKWLRTGMVARLTNEDVLTEETESNMRLSKVLNLLYPDPTEKRMIINQISKLTRKIVTSIEEEIGPFGELAVDVCIDQYSTIKLLEINSKPDNLFSQIRAYQLRNIAGVRLLNYAASLVGYESE